MDNIINWLFEGPSWVKYRTKLDLLDQSGNDSEVINTRAEVLKDKQIIDLISELKNWPGYELKNHNDAAHPIHKFLFLADIGLKYTDPGMKTIIGNIIEHRSDEGLIQTFIHVPKYFGGADEGKWTWMLCDAPAILYSLIKLGLKENKIIRNAVGYLASLVSDNGWRCIVSKDNKFRGPGKKDDACPYATLLMLKLLSQYDEFRDSSESKIGAETLFNLWEKSKDLHPYLFYMGTDFRKLKTPLVWYNILHVVDVLTLFPSLKNDTRLKEMNDIIISKADNLGKFTPESIYIKLKDWEFSQKKEPSRWLTFLVKRIQKRFE